MPRRYVYPPLLALLISPWANESWADGLYLGLSVLGVGSLALLPLQLLKQATPPWIGAVYAVSVVASVPALQCLLWGQVSIFLVLLGLCGFYALQRAPVLSGALLGLSVSIKLYPALLLPWLLSKRNIRALFSAGGTLFLLLAIAPGLCIGWDETRSYYQHIWIEMKSLEKMVFAMSGSQAVTARILAMTPWNEGTPRMIVRTLSAVLGVSWMWFGDSACRRQQDSWMWSFVVYYSAFFFFIDTSWLHYFVQLPLGWFLLLRALQTPLKRRLGVRVLLGSSVFLGTLPSYLLFGWSLHILIGFVFWSQCLMMTGMIFVWTDPGDDELTTNFHR